MKKFFRILSALLVAVVVLSCCGCSYSDNTAKGYDEDKLELCRVIDDKGIFSEEQVEELSELVRETAEKVDMHLVIYISGTFIGEYSTPDFAGDLYEEIFGEDTDGALYYMDLGEGSYAYDYISTHGKGILMYDTDAMFDVIYNYLPSTGETIYANEIYSAVKKICEEFEKHGKGDPGALSFAYDEYTDKYIFFRDGKTVVSTTKPLVARIPSMFISLIIGVVASLLFYFITKSNYKFKASCNPHVYVAGEQTQFTAKEDRYIRTATTRTKIESSSGGGRSGGGRSGGGSRGGGGRRR